MTTADKMQMVQGEDPKRKLGQQTSKALPKQKDTEILHLLFFLGN